MWLACLPSCMYVCLPAHLSVYPTCMSMCLSASLCLPIHLSFCLPVCVCLPVCLSAYQPVCVFLPACLLTFFRPTCLSDCLSTVCPPGLLLTSHGRRGRLPWPFAHASHIQYLHCGHSAEWHNFPSGFNLWVMVAGWQRLVAFLKQYNWRRSQVHLAENLIPSDLQWI